MEKKPFVTLEQLKDIEAALQTEFSPEDYRFLDEI